MSIREQYKQYLERMATEHNAARVRKFKNMPPISFEEFKEALRREGVEK